MIAWFRRLLHPGSYRRDEMDKLVHGIRNQAQVADLEKHLMRMKREKRERQDIADALARTRPPWRQGADQP